MIENELRDVFARHEHLAPDPGPLGRAIDVATGRRRRRRMVGRSVGAALAITAVLAVPAFLRGAGDGTAAPSVEVASSASPPPVVAAAGRPLTVLVIGTDAGRAETILIAHVPAAHDAVYLISLPRDGRVAVPGYGGDAGLSVAFESGGADLMRRTVDDLTGLRFDGTVTVGYDTVAALTDQLGGVRVCQDAGCAQLGGADGTALLRARHDVPDGAASPDRAGQRYLSALAARSAGAGLLTLMRIAGNGISVDDAGRTLLAEAGGIDLAGAPVVGIGAPRHSEIPLDGGGTGERIYPATATELFQAIAADSLAAFVAAHPDHVTG